MTVLLQLVVIVVLTILEGFFVSAEIETFPLHSCETRCCEQPSAFASAPCEPTMRTALRMRPRTSGDAAASIMPAFVPQQ